MRIKYVGFIVSNPTTLQYDYHSIGAGLIYGYESYLFKKICFDILLGIGVRKEVDSRPLDTFINFFSQPRLERRLALNIGYKF